jgi:hypothetical protein
MNLKQEQVEKVERYKCSICRTEYDQEHKAQLCLGRGRDYVDLPETIIGVGKAKDKLVLEYLLEKADSLYSTERVTRIVLRSYENRDHETKFEWDQFLRHIVPYPKNNEYWVFNPNGTKMLPKTLSKLREYLKKRKVRMLSEDDFRIFTWDGGFKEFYNLPFYRDATFYRTHPELKRIFREEGVENV